MCHHHDVEVGVPDDGDSTSSPAASFRGIRRGFQQTFPGGVDQQPAPLEVGAQNAGAVLRLCGIVPYRVGARASGLGPGRG